MRSAAVFLLLMAIKLSGRILFRVELEWISPKPQGRWPRLRLLALLNHTSLFEPVFAAAAPNRLLWRIAAHGVIPVADKTIARPWVGRFFRFMADQVVPVTRERDHTWADVVSHVHDPEALLIILPEGRMKRRDGLDAHGNPMTVKGGIADLIATLGEGEMLLGYSEGLHHIHAPGERFPRLFRKVRLGIEIVDLADFRAAVDPGAGPDAFKHAVIAELTRRRNRYCPDCPPVPAPGAVSETVRA